MNKSLHYSIDFSLCNSVCSVLSSCKNTRVVKSSLLIPSIVINRLVKRNLLDPDFCTNSAVTCNVGMLLLCQIPCSEYSCRNFVGDVSLYPVMGVFDFYFCHNSILYICEHWCSPTVSSGQIQLCVCVCVCVCV